MCDTKEEIEQSIGSLADLHKLIQARRTLRRGANGEDDHRLGTFVLFGRLVLDTFAQTMMYRTDTERTHSVDPLKIWPTPPAVLTAEEFRKEIFRRANNDDVSLSLSPRSIPTENVECNGCNNKWSIHNFWDSCYCDGWWHPSCLAVYTESVTYKRLHNAFLCAGFNEDRFVMSPIANEYGSESYRGSWYQVQTHVGMFKIGWRKRVIAITWPNHPDDVKLLTLFEKVDDTKDETGIHAWNYAQAADYLNRVRDKLEFAFQVR